MARYIDADDVLAQTKPLEWTSPYELGLVYGWNQAIDYIGNFAPTAEVKPAVRGENLGGGAFLCSACGFDDVAHSHTVKFCPNCGAEIINARPADEDDSGLQK